MTHRDYAVSCVWSVGAELGEGPLWVAEQQRLYFVDIKAGKLHAFEPTSGRQRSWNVPGYICWIVARRDGDGFMVGLRDAIARLWLEPEVRMDKLDLDIALAPDVRFNDAKVDRFGSIWAGSMHNLDYGQAAGRLFRMGPELDVSIAEQGLHICNGPAFSLDGATMYHTDTYRGQVCAYPIDSHGRAGAARLWRQFDQAAEGGPDGMCTDAEGGLWIAQWGGARVCRYLPDGSLSATVHLPVSQPSSCTFGGPNLRTLYITSARQELTRAQLAREPLAGALFAVDTGIPGAPAYRFG